MLLTSQTKNQAVTLVEGPQGNNPAIFPDATRRRILNSAVRMVGSNRQSTGTFTGSGVIYKLDATYAYILTAAHNVEMWAGLTTPPKDWSDPVSAFVQAMSVKYGGKENTQNKNMTFNQDLNGTADKKENVTDGLPLPGPCANSTGRCTYDVVAFKTKDSNLRTYAQQAVFNNQSLEEINELVQTECEMVAYSTSVLLDPGSYYFVQLGFGKIQDDRFIETLDKGKVAQKKVIQKCGTGFTITDNHLHYRLTSPQARKVASVYGQTAKAGVRPSYLEYASAIVLDGPPSSSTCSGDSGGPLWAVEKDDMTKVYLLGVTTGADMFTSPQLTSTVFTNVISASLAPFFTA